MNKRIKKKLAKRLNIRKYSDYKIYKGFIHDFTISRIALSAVFSAKHLLPNPAQADQMMMYVNAMKDEFKLDKVSITNTKKLYATAVEEDGEGNGETSNNKEEA